MEYVVFGNTGLKVSRLCLGAMNFPLECDFETTVATFQDAFDAGINFIDNADAYGRGESEEVMGRALKETSEQRENYVIATKCWVKMFDRKGGGGGRGGGCSRRHIIQACENSLQRLQTDYIDLYQLHHPDPITPVEETLEALDRLIKDGKILYAGVCNHYAWQMAEMLGKASLHNLQPIISAQVSYSILDRVIENETIPFCRKFNVAIMGYGPLRGGILTGKYKRDEEPPEGSRFSNPRMAKHVLSDDIFDTVEELEDIAERNGMLIHQLAMKWVLKNEAITTPILGGSKREHFQPMYGLFDMEVDPADMERIDEMSERHRYQPFGNQSQVGGYPNGPAYW
ncbi:MAG: aldo/keto reductase [candidate division WS1 bacterium]|jgi:aryl-alcohol dehydrogenase-like predicted oxidoreductase|nr:aldo/keto reductase [candidate division WS1 bacterium]